MPYANTVVAVGGSELPGDYGTQIYKLECLDMEQPNSECVWTELEQKLNIGRNYPVAMMIPDHFTLCEHPENKFFQSLGKAATSFLVSKIARRNAFFEGYVI